MSGPLLVPGRTVWRVEPCRRAAVLIDGACFFGAVRAALLAARHSIFVIGWDIDSRTELVGEGRPDDGLPTAFGPFLAALVSRRPDLRVRLLLWDYPLLYTYEREKLPRLAFDWQTPPQVSFCLDATVSYGSCQHQKLVIVDDALAFCGGLDLTIRRWDTCRHELHQAGRVDPDGRPYDPFHDVQMMVDGRAARALATLARERWRRAAAEDAPAIDRVDDPWPAHVVPDFTDVEIGIARTQPRFTDESEAREVEGLFHDSIDRAERVLYIENQFTTSARIAGHLASRLRRNPRLEVVIVAPHAHPSFLESRTMRNGRIRFCRTVRKAAGGRVRFVSPTVARNGKVANTMIHSKVMVVDDRLLRVGSANLNNRSMGADTECDLAIEAANDRQRAAIVSLRNRLIGEHCGATAEEVAQALAGNPSLVHLVDTLSRNGHRLEPIDDGPPDRSPFMRLVERVADPPRPLRLSRLMGRVVPRVLGVRQAMHSFGAARLLLPVGIVVALLVLTLAWRVTDLADYADPDRIRSLLAVDVASPLAPLLVVACFVLAGFVAFPVVILIFVTAAIFGPWLGMAYAAAGVATSACILYAAGAWLGSEHLRHLLGSRWPRLRGWLQRRGLLAVVALRVLPMAPFTVVNLAVGASGIRFFDFALGTLIGLGPGLVAMAFLGSRIVDIVENPSAGLIALLALAAGGWIAVAFVAQRLVLRLGENASKGTAKGTG
ncbi:MAG TPA: VTT domain-containing protein [Reyranella sp.]|nr:VTT domain-containing protein [Reyranella sp.]